MRNLIAIIFFLIAGQYALAQKGEPNRLLTSAYYPQAVEQAAVSLVAGNVVSASQQVEYRAGKSVLLTTGFEAKAGSIFAAHTDYVGVNIGDMRSDHMLIKTYPNPFVEKTTIVYELGSTVRTSVFVSDMEGRVVGNLVDNQLQEAGHHEVEWRAGQLPAGSYICTLNAGKQNISTRVFIK